MERNALDAMFSAAYEELRRLASSVRRDDPNATINPTALVHEAWLRLAGTPSFQAQSPLHFKRVAARAMRQVLVDASRRRNAQKRGDGTPLVAFDEALHGGAASADEVLALDEALEQLSRVSPRQAQMVESRFFGGFDCKETAEILGISEATVLRDWRAAKAWLAQELRRG